MKHLQDSAKNVLESKTANEKLELLGKAFELFSLETTRLEASYTQLSEQFRLLNLQLAEANHKLEHKISELHLVTDYLKNILDNMTQGIFFITLEGTITTYNKAAEAILEIPSDQVLTNKFWDVFDDHIFGFSIRNALATQQAPATSCTNYHLNTTRELELVTTIVIDEEFQDEQPELGDNYPPPTQGMIIMLRDVTDLRRLQLLSNRNDRMQELGEMAAQVAHEIRNPLGGIKGFAALLKRDLADHSPQQKMAEHIIEGTDELSALVTQILDYARPPQPHFERTDMLEIFEEIKQHLLANEDFRKQKLTLKVDSPADSVFVDLDLHLFKAALLNLVINSVQAMPQGGAITLSLQQRHDNVIVMVSDTGEGISKENLEKIFSPFFTTKPNGNGFGLAEVHKAVLAHQGTVEVKSTAGKGTTFIIKLPIKHFRA